MTTSPAPAASALGVMKLYNAVLGVTTLLVFLQGLTAGVFMALRGDSSAETWTTVHLVLGWLAVVFALVTAVVAVLRVRVASPVVAYGTVALFVLLLVETLLGVFVKSAGGLVGVHVPLAMAMMALVVWLSLRGAQLRRTLSAG